MVAFGHHAQNDRWAIEIVFPALTGGFFVEAGACGGHLGSASYVLEREFGWNGICVEPMDEYYRTLRRLRCCATDPRCLSDTTGDMVDFYSYPADPARSGIAALNNNGQWAERGQVSGETTTKETVKLGDLLEQHHAPDTIHYLCLDIEGAELTVLQAFDFSSSRKILALSIEGPRCDALLTAQGYRQVSNPFDQSRIDHYFVDASLMGPLQHLLID